MFKFFKFSKKNLLPNEPFSESIIDHMRDYNFNQKDFDNLKKKAFLIAKGDCSYKGIIEFFNFINLSTNYHSYHVVKNRHDLDFYVNDIKNLYASGSRYIGKQQILILCESLDIAYQYLVDSMAHETAIETLRKNTIEKAGLYYSRHTYPDNHDFEELFLHMPQNPEDHIYEKAKNILKKKRELESPT